MSTSAHREPAGFTHRFQPATADGEPTLLLLHGTGGDENNLIELGRRLAPRAALLSPRGNVLEHGAPRFFRRLAEGVFDLEDLHRRTHELADFVAESAARYAFDPTTVIAVGFSNGANIAASTLLLRPQTLRAAVLLAPMMLGIDPAGVDLSANAVFIGAGRQDQIAPAAQAQQLAVLLTERGAAVELHWHAGGHSVELSTLAAAQDWLTKLRGALSIDPLP